LAVILFVPKKSITLIFGNTIAFFLIKFKLILC
jgi:hypothetical protein